MSALLRYTRESTPISKRFTVFPYYGSIGSTAEYYFTASGDSLYRIEEDLSGVNQWVVARDMGKEMFINLYPSEAIFLLREKMLTKRSVDIFIFNCLYAW